MTRPCLKGSERWHIRAERTAAHRRRPSAMVASASQIQPRTPGTLGIPGDRANLPLYRAGVPHRSPRRVPRNGMDRLRGSQLRWRP